MKDMETQETVSKVQNNVLNIKESRQVSQDAKDASKKRQNGKVKKDSKRKASANNVTKSKTKKQKVDLETPELSSRVLKVFVVGDNSCGQLGLNPDDVDEKKRPALLEMKYAIVDAVAGAMHSVCLTESGKVCTFGCNDEGALGRLTEEGSEYVPGLVDLPEVIVQVSAGDSHTAALSETGNVYIWGNFRNNSGAIGLIKEDTKETLPVRILNGTKIVKISSGSDHFSCLSDKGILYTIGNGETGQLGRVSKRSCANGGRNGMNVLLNPLKVSISSKYGSQVTDVWNGSLCTFLKLNNNSVLACGLNNYGQLGLSNPDPNNPSVYIPKPTFRNKNWKQINADQHHTLALDNEGLVYSLGRSDYGRLGRKCEGETEPTKIPTLENKTCINISCGSCTSFAVEDNGSVYSFGMGTNFQLGHGNDEDQDIPKLIEGNFHKLYKAVKVSCGGQHAVLLAYPRNTSEEAP